MNFCPRCGNGPNDEAEAASQSVIPPQGHKNPEDKSARRRQRRPLLIGVCLLIIAGMVGGFFWLSHDQDVDPATAAEHVLYLEMYDSSDTCIGSASGFLINDGVTLVTNYHVMEDAYRMVAMTADGDGQAEVSTILAYDEAADLAVLRCDNEPGATPLSLADSDGVKQGDSVYAAGYPLGLTNTLSNGIVSSRYIENQVDILQITAAISSGSSGGALLNEHGQVIGVVCAYYEYGQNLNIAIASNEVSELLSDGTNETRLKQFYRDVHPQGASEDVFADDFFGEAENPQDNGSGPNESETNEPSVPSKAPEQSETDEPSTSSKAPEQSETTEYLNYVFDGAEFAVPDFGGYFNVPMINSSSDREFGFLAIKFHYHQSDLQYDVGTAVANYGALLLDWGYTYSHSTENSGGTTNYYKNSQYMVSVGVSVAVDGAPFQVCIMPRASSDVSPIEPELPESNDDTWDTEPGAADGNRPASNIVGWVGRWVFSDDTPEMAKDNWFEFDFDQMTVIWNYNYGDGGGRHRYPFQTVNAATLEMSQFGDLSSITDRFILNSNGTIERTWIGGDETRTWILRKR